MERVAALCVLTGLFSAGCAEEGEELRANAPVRYELRCAELPRSTPEDSFWLAQAISDANRPPAQPVRRTVSLGYIGDEPLGGGVSRDTPMPSRGYPDPFASMAAPFRTDHYTSTYGRGYRMGRTVR